MGTAVSSIKFELNFRGEATKEQNIESFIGQNLPQIKLLLSQDQQLSNQFEQVGINFNDLTTNDLPNFISSLSEEEFDLLEEKMKVLQEK